MTTTLDQISEAASRLATARTEARVNALAAIELALRLVQRALGGDRLRGMPNLGSSGNPYRGLQVRAKHADRELPLPKWRGGDDWGDEVLVFGEWAGIAFVRRNDAGDFNERPLGEDDLKAEDVEHVAETIVEACRRHLAASERSTAQYDDLSRLAGRIRQALETP